MKRILFAALLGLMTVASSQAQLIWYDAMDYPVGNITTNTDSPWIRHSGSGNDSFVVDYAGSPAASAGRRYEVNQTRSDDIHRWLDPVDTNGYGGLALYASFTLSANSLPASANGTYFAHFMDSGIQFRGRIFALTTNAYPGMFRLGIANAAADASSTGAKIIPIDLALNTDYQVVIKYDFDLTSATLWINPASEADTANSSGGTGDLGPVTNAITALAFRQAVGEGVLEIRNVAVGSTFADVVTNTPSLPAIGLQPVGVTNYSGNSGTLVVAASGMGLLNYQWYKDGSAVGGATSPRLEFTSFQGSDQGNYYCEISNSAGTAKSASAYVSVDASPIAPVIMVQPQSFTNSIGSAIALTVTATGPAPLSYQWNFYGTNLPEATASTLTLASLSNANAGPYFCTVGNNYGTRDSAIAFVAVLPPLATNIAYLRTLVDTATWLPTNTTALFQVEGTVITFTNITTAANAQFYIEDDTAGITVFVSGGSTVRPKAGDRVRVVGPLATFNSLLELGPVASNPNHSVTTLGTDYPMPAAKAFVFSQTNDLPTMEKALEGALVTITNVYFPSGGGTAKFSANANVTVTNALGEGFILRVDSRSLDFNGVSMPAFAYQVTGVMGQFLSTTATPRNGGYQLIITRPQDVVSALPAVPTINVVRAGGVSTLTWPNTTGSTFSVYGSDNLGGALNRIAFGLNSLGGTIQFSDSDALSSAKFYRISSP